MLKTSLFLLSLMVMAIPAEAQPVSVGAAAGVGMCQGSCGGVDPGAQVRIFGAYRIVGALRIGGVFSGQWFGSRDMDGLHILRGGMEASWTFHPVKPLTLRVGAEIGVATTGFSVTTAQGSSEEVSESGTYSAVTLTAGFRLRASLILGLTLGYAYHFWSERNDDDLNNVFVLAGVTWSLEE